MLIDLDIRGVEGGDECVGRPGRGRSRKDRLASVGQWMDRSGWYRPMKRGVEFVAALVLLVLTGPLMLLAALLVKVTSRGPAFYTQTRIGLGGRPFTIYKIRTMIHNAESLTGPRWAIPGDPRVTRIGYVLRITHLDELPQLLNVLRGDMSLIGPRPERPEFIGELERALPGYRRRLVVRPGVTGLAQVQLPADSDLDSVRRKLQQDLYYVRACGPWLDFRLVCCTACRMLGIPIRISGWLLRIPTSDAIAEVMKTTVPEVGTPAPARMRKAA